MVIDPYANQAHAAIVSDPRADQAHAAIVSHLLRAALFQEAEALGANRVHISQLHVDAFDPQADSSPPLKPRSQKAVRSVLGPCRAQRLGEKLSCPICLESNQRMFVRKMPCCGQVIHSACVDRWFRSGHSQCPLCRHECFRCEEAADSSTTPAARSAET